MATYHGNDGSVLVGANAVGEVVSFSYNESANIIRDDAMGDADETNIAGKNSATGSITAHFDSGDTDGQVELTAGSSVSLVLHPEGTGTGLTELSFTAIVSSRAITVEHEGIVQVQFDFTRTGATTEGDQS